MAVSKRTKKNAYQRVLRFPQAKGKIIERAELSVSSDYFTVDIRFQDKTMLSFDLSHASRSFLNSSTGKPEITNCSNDGGPFTADHLASEPEPAARRVFGYDAVSRKPGVPPLPGLDYLLHLTQR